MPAKGTDSILCYPGCPVDATRWHLSQAANTLSLSVFSVMEMGSLLQVYATTGLNLMNTNRCCISFHSSSESQRPMALAIDNVANPKVNFFPFPTSTLL